LQIDELGQFYDLSIPLRFNGPQPNAYGVDPASSRPCQSGELVGDTRRGGSCNFEQYTFIPHCSGTHTECVGHITNERISVVDRLKDAFVSARLVSVEPEDVGGDRVIMGRSLANALAGGSPALQSLIVRTLPNDESKLTAVYDGDNIPPYFSTDAMELIVASGYKHLLVDLPSIDRLFDDGKLANHRIFWNVEPGSFEANAGTRLNSTITELIYVPNEAADGEYILNLQIAPFAADAAPSRPVIWPADGVRSV
jgi:kynurenine formamidase